MKPTILDLPRNVRELVSPLPKPPGYVTCWGFLLRTEPWVLSLMLDPVGGLIEDERRARRIAGEMRTPFMVFPAPRELLVKGLGEIGAYPLKVLKRVFPVNP